MIENFDAMAVAGMVFAIAMIVVIAWIGRAVILKGMEMGLAREQAKATLKHEQEYQRIAREASRAQSEVAEQLKRLDVMEERLANIERILREVDEPVMARR